MYQDEREITFRRLPNRSSLKHTDSYELSAQSAFLMLPKDLGIHEYDSCSQTEVVRRLQPRPYTMPPPLQEELSIPQIYESLGKPKSPGQKKKAAAQVYGQNQVADLRKAQLKRNIHRAPVPEMKPELEKVKIDVTSDLEIVETQDDPDDIDFIDPETQQRVRFLRAIPHFERLFNKTQSYLPRYIFRVVHSESAGKVFLDENGLTHFQSHACLQNDGPANLEDFGMDEIAQQLKCHINGWRSTGGTPFASHFISTTDSFERAINKAQRHYIKNDVQAVNIYVIDTHSLQNSAIVFLMALALRAWDVLVLMPKWKASMFMHGALTEWIFWDEIVASKVEKIEYSTFAWPQRGDEHNLPTRLKDVIPRVVEAGRHSANTREGVSRSVLHAYLYASSKQEKERQEFRLQTYATRNGPLPQSPFSVKKDRRVQIDDKSLHDVWHIVQALGNRNLLFIWILSLMTQRYYAENIVKRVVERYPEVVEQSLELITKCSDTNSELESMLVCFMSARDCLGRVDVNEFQNMMLACVKEWYYQIQAKTDHMYYGIKLYIVTGQARPSRNLTQAKELGFLGNCKTEPLLHDTTATLRVPSFDQIVTFGQRIMPPETDEDHRLRIERETGNMFYAPDDIPMVTTSRVGNDVSHRSAPARLTSDPTAQP